ncbi:hypothetical protein AVDCRST_MAG81-82, partial [uncultured Synechococcales cyanobacterium]
AKKRLFRTSSELCPTEGALPA